MTLMTTALALATTVAAATPPASSPDPPGDTIDCCEKPGKGAQVGKDKKSDRPDCAAFPPPGWERPCGPGISPSP